MRDLADDSQRARHSSWQDANEESEHCRGCTSGARLSGEAPAAERLQQAAARKAAHIERLRAEVQAAEQAACTFAPQLATAGHPCKGLHIMLHICYTSC